MKTPLPLFAFLPLLIWITGCGSKPTTKTPPAPPASESEVTKFILSTSPENPSRIMTVRSRDIKAGANVTLKGRIGGRVDPFVDGRASFVIADDEAIIACDNMEDDHCETPWDYCCVAPEKVAAATASVQLVDPEGNVIKESLDGIGGLAPGKHVVVTGTIAEGSGPESLLINAAGLHVAQATVKPDSTRPEKK